MLLSVAELMLIYRPGLGLADSHSEWIPTDWFALLGAWSILCGCVIVSVSRGLKSGLSSSAYSDNLAYVVRNYRDRLWFDYRSAFATGALSLVLFLAWRLDLAPDDRWAKGVAALVALAFIIGGIRSQQNASREIDANLQHSPSLSEYRLVDGQQPVHTK